MKQGLRLGQPAQGGLRMVGVSVLTDTELGEGQQQGWPVEGKEMKGVES